jgi:zinc-ribbon domain
MPKNIHKDDTIVDPAALWLASQEVPVSGVLAEPEVLEPRQAAPEGGKFCSQCGVQAGPGARFCAHCGSPMSPAPVAGAGYLAEAGARVTGRPRPVEELSPAERAERERLHLQAMQAGRTDPPLQFAPSQEPAVTIHFVSNGFSFAGVVWMRGQEIKMGPDHPRWAEAQAWIHLDEPGQVERYGRVMFRSGPWPFRQTYRDGVGAYEQRSGLAANEAPVTGPTADQLAQADEMERRRNGAVPLPTLA